MRARPTSAKPDAAWKATDAGLGGSRLTSQTTRRWPARRAALEQTLVQATREATSARRGRDDDAVDVKLS